MLDQLGAGRAKALPLFAPATAAWPSKLRSDQSLVSDQVHGMAWPPEAQRTAWKMLPIARAGTMASRSCSVGALGVRGLLEVYQCLFHCSKPDCSRRLQSSSPSQPRSPVAPEECAEERLIGRSSCLVLRSQEKEQLGVKSRRGREAGRCQQRVAVILHASEVVPPACTAPGEERLPCTFRAHRRWRTLTAAF